MFNRLEQDILEWFKGKYAKSTLADQLSSAKFVSRRWTRVGFYVDIEVDKKLSRLKIDDYGGSFPIIGLELSLMIFTITEAAYYGEKMDMWIVLRCMHMVIIFERM
jgi:hypothetical protein